MGPQDPEVQAPPSKGISLRLLETLEIPPHTFPPSGQLPPRTFYSSLSKKCTTRSDAAFGTLLLLTYNKYECQTLPEPLSFLSEAPGRRAATSCLSCGSQGFPYV